MNKKGLILLFLAGMGGMAFTLAGIGFIIPLRTTFVGVVAAMFTAGAVPLLAFRVWRWFPEYTCAISGMALYAILAFAAGLLTPAALNPFIHLMISLSLWIPIVLIVINLDKNQIRTAKAAK